MSHRRYRLFCSRLVLAGGLGLLAIAISAAYTGVWSAASFIGVLGACLVGAVAYVELGLYRMHIQ